MARQYVIVGNGPAGLSAAESVRSLEPSADITIIGEERVGFYSRPGLAYLLASTIPESQLFSRGDREYQRLGIRRRVGRVSALDPRKHRIQLEDGSTVPYDRLLLAMGARALRPPVPGIDLEGVVTLDTLEDARRILRLARRTKAAVVVGGGITALELAEGLTAQGVETHYFLRKDRYWGNVLDAHESALVESRLEKEGIHLHRRTDLAAVEGRGGRVAGVLTADGRRLRCGMVAVAIGIQPRLELAREAGLAVGRGIWTDELFQTSEPDVLAAGDVAEVFDPATGNRVLDSLWSVAIEQGRWAGVNMAGVREAYPRQAPFNVTRIGGLTTTLIGSVGTGHEDGDLVALARGDSDAWRQEADAFSLETEAEVSRVRVLIGERRIVGALVMGDQGLSRPLQHWVREAVDIRPFRERLIREPGSLAAVLHSVEGLPHAG